MTTEVFFVGMLIYVSGTAAEGNASTSKPDPQIDLVSMIRGTHMKWPNSGFEIESFSTDDYESYYDHIIDLGLQKLTANKEGYSIEAIINTPEPNPEMPETFFFDGLHSLSRMRNPEDNWPKHTESIRFLNGDLHLKDSFELSNISANGNFSGLTSMKESHLFQLHPNNTMINVNIRMPKNSSSKWASVKFANSGNSGKDINSRPTLILKEKAKTGFTRLFKDLANIIHERLYLTARKEDPSYDKILDNVINKFNRNAEPLNIGGGGSVSNTTARIDNRWNLTFYALHSLTKLSKVKVMNEINGEPDLQTTIQFGNVSGNGRVFHRTPETTIDEAFTFTSTPVVVDANFYLPRNESFAAKTFNILTKPKYNIQPQNEQFRSVFQQLLKYHGKKVYPHVLYRILNETHKEVFPKTN